MPIAPMLIALGLIALPGCQSELREARVPADIEEYGQLLALEATRDPALRDQYARVKEQKGTPKQLNATGVKNEDNAAAVLVGLFDYGEIGALLAETDALFPAREFEFDADRLGRAIMLRRQHERELDVMRQAIGRPECDLGIEFMAGYAADTSVIDVVRILVRLEGFRTAEQLADRDLDGAIETLDVIFRLIACLSHAPHLDARLHAAYARTEAFQPVAAVLFHPDLRVPHVEKLQRLVRRQLDRWPDAAAAWIGERALGMHAYEMVRDGRLNDLLTREEREQFREDGFDDALAALTPEAIDADEVYYLQTMGRVIDSCRKPYHQRQEVLEQLARELEARADAPDYPVIAGRLLLKDVMAAHALQARDRANTEAWALALACMVDADGPPELINPLTGKPYHVDRRDGLLVISEIGRDNRPGSRITVPAQVPP